MDKENSLSLKSKQRYLNLIYRITQQKIAGSDPSDELLEEARALGNQVDIPEEELADLGLADLHKTNENQRKQRKMKSSTFNQIPNPVPEVPS